MGFSPTGKGKVEEKQVGPPLSSVTGIQASLFNYDTNGTTLKTEHKTWLDARAVPLLVADRSRTIQMTGSASKVGSNAANMIVSEKRVKGVRDYLVSKNVLPDQISFTFTGEELSTSQLENDERDRAVHVLVVTGFAGRTAPVIFQRKNNSPLASRNDGFDDAVGFRPAWVMVPFGVAFKEVRVRNGNGTTLISTNRGVARVVNPDRPGFEILRLSSDNQVIGIKPEGLGTASIRVLDGGQEVGRLDVSVKQKIEIKTTFHFVQDLSKPAGRLGIGTVRSQGNVDPLSTSSGITTLEDLLRKVNEIFVPQANIVFLASKGLFFRDLPIRRNIGVEVQLNRREWDTIVLGPPDNRHLGSDFNVFFVREHEIDLNRATDDLAASAGVTGTDARRFRSCIVEDNTEDTNATVGVILAHEAGHTLDTAIDRDPNVALHDTTNNSRLLMADGPGEQSRKIDRFWADRFNPD
jgi:hypothetical protein